MTLTAPLKAPSLPSTREDAPERGLLETVSEVFSALNIRARRSYPWRKVLSVGVSYL